ncbi:MAG: hypothetical protein WA130_07305 [Candidatus Methanoperedens sp.]
MKSIKLISILFLMLVLLPMPALAFWNVEMSESGDSISINYCVGSSGGYYKLKSATNTYLRSSYLTADKCVSYTESKSYLYSLERGVWVAYVSDSSGAIMAFRSFNVNPVAIPTASPTYTVSPTPYPTYNPYPVPTVTYQPYPQPTVTPFKPKIIPKPIADALHVKETPGFQFQGVLAVVGLIIIWRYKNE